MHNLSTVTHAEKRNPMAGIIRIYYCFTISFALMVRSFAFYFICLTSGFLFAFYRSGLWSELTLLVCLLSSFCVVIFFTHPTLSPCCYCFLAAVEDKISREKETFTAVRLLFMLWYGVG